MPRSIIGWFVVCWSAFLLASVVVGGLLLSQLARRLRRGPKPTRQRPEPMP